jgi:hypothetical protein
MEIVTETEWLAARSDLLTREKEFTHRGDDEYQSSQVID